MLVMKKARVKWYDELRGLGEAVIEGTNEVLKLYVTSIAPNSYGFMPQIKAGDEISCEIKQDARHGFYIYKLYLIS